MSERLDYNTQLLSQYPPTPFSYNPEQQQFTVGNQKISLADYINHEVSITEPISIEQAHELVTSTKLAENIFGNLVQLPSMYEWLVSLDNHSLNQARTQVTEAMIDAYKVLKPDHPELLKGSHWGFGMGLIRPGHPIFNVLGDCACFGVNIYGNMFGQDDFDDGFAEYGLHNIDQPIQKVALYAGAGALATLCEANIS